MRKGLLFFLRLKASVIKSHCLRGLAVSAYDERFGIDQMRADGLAQLFCKRKRKISLQGFPQHIKNKGALLSNVSR